MKPSIKAIFFDIGGTLRVTHEAEERDLNKINELISFLGDKSTIDEFIAKIHKGEKTYRKWCKPSFVELPEADLWTRFLLPDYPKDFIRQNAIKINQLWRDSRHKYLLPDVVSTLNTLNKRGYKLGLISNTTSSVEGHQLLAENGLTSLFSSVILSASFGQRKPHPSLFLAASHQAGVRPENCAYVGDRPSRDLIGALQSGYGQTVIINANGYTTDDFDPDDYDPENDTELIIKADYFIGQLSQLLDIYPDLNTLQNAPFKKQTSPGYLYDVALSTMWGVDQKRPFNTTFEIAKRIGISRFELNHKVTAELLKKYDQNHNYISTVHDPCPAPYTYDELKQKDLLISSLVEENRIKGVDHTKRTIELASQLGAKSIVLHPGSIQCDRSKDHFLRELYASGLKGSSEYEKLRIEMVEHRKKFADQYNVQIIKSLEEIIVFAKGSGVKVGLENRYRYYDIPLPDELAQFLALCPDDFWGLQYDIGHGHALSELGLVDYEIWLKNFSKRIIGVHIHDVNGIQDHQAPGLGSVDFKAISTYLPENCLKTLEIGPWATLRDIAAGLEILVESGFIKKYELN